MFIKLTVELANKTGEFLVKYINMNEVYNFGLSNNTKLTRMHLVAGGCLDVKETPEEIMEKIESKLSRLYERPGDREEV